MIENDNIQHTAWVFELIAGPCAAESETQVMAIAHDLHRLGVKTMRAGVWKPRTKPGSFEGIGSNALVWLQQASVETGIQMATEVATPDHVEQCLRHDIRTLWIGARTATNPFAVQAIADALRGTSVRVLIKNPVSPDVDLWIGAIERISEAGISDVAAVHRGFSLFGEKIYRNAPMWQIPIELRRRMPQLPIICDPSHIGGKRDLILPLAQEALDLGCDGLMIECHNNPDKALSDAKQQLTPDCLKTILQQLHTRDRINYAEDLEALRRDIDIIDNQLIDILAQRMDISRRIGKYKLKKNITILQAARYNDILDRRTAEGEKRQLSAEFIRRLFADIHEESVRQQVGLEREK